MAAAEIPFPGATDAAAVEATVGAFRVALVRRYGEPWFLERELLVGRLARALVARVAPAARDALIGRWCAEGIPRLEQWLAELDAPLPPAA